MRVAKSAQPKILRRGLAVAAGYYLVNDLGAFGEAAMREVDQARPRHSMLQIGDSLRSDLSSVDPLLGLCEAMEVERIAQATSPFRTIGPALSAVPDSP